MSSILTPDELFAMAGQAATAGWFMLVFLPRRIKPLFWIPQYIIPFGLGLLYSGLMLAHFFTSDGGFGSLGEVRALFENEHILLAGWVHYLAFDLFIGSWIAQQADKIGMPRLIQAVLLIGTLMFGPLGLVLFLSIRSLFLKSTENAQYV